MRDGADRAREIHEQRLDMWVGKPVKNHVRVLLCTLPDVLWQGHGWTRIGMDKLQDAAQVKKAYRKYIAAFHPDRFTAEGNHEKIYIANTVFSAIQEQWEVFKKENGIK